MHCGVELTPRNESLGPLGDNLTGELYSKQMNGVKQLL